MEVKKLILPTIGAGATYLIASNFIKNKYIGLGISGLAFYLLYSKGATYEFKEEVVPTEDEKNFSNMTNSSVVKDNFYNATATNLGCKSKMSSPHSYCSGNKDGNTYGCVDKYLQVTCTPPNTSCGCA